MSAYGLRDGLRQSAYGLRDGLRQSAYGLQRSLRTRLLDQFEQPIRAEGNLANLETGAAHRIFHRLREDGARGNAAGLSHAFQTNGVERRRRLAMIGLDGRHIGRRWQEVVHERRIHELTLLVVHELFEERVANAPRHASVNLSLHQQWIDDGAAVVDHDVAKHFNHRRFGIDLDDDGVDAAGSGPAIGPEVSGAFEAWLGAGPHGSSQGIRLRGQFGERHAERTLHRHAAVAKFQLIFWHVE